jgi:hypothetical protein
MSTEDAKKLLKALSPLSCTQVRQWLAAWVRDALDVEQADEIRDHVLVCDTCLLAFTEVVEHQVDTGAIPLQAWPSALPLPPQDLFATTAAPVPPPVAAVATALAAVSETFGIVWDNVKQAAHAGLAEAQAALVEGRRCLEGARAFWRQMFPELQEAHLGAAAAPMMGADVSGLTAEVVDETWQPQGRVVPFTIATPGGWPVLTADGRFTLTVQTPETQWHGAEVVCTLVLVETRRLSFTSVVRPAPTGAGGEVRFTATELLQGPADVLIPLEFVQLVLRPSAGAGR